MIDTDLTDTFCIYEDSFHTYLKIGKFEINEDNMIYLYNKTINNEVEYLNLERTKMNE